MFWLRTSHLQRKGDVLAHGSSRQEAEVLKDDANPSTKLWHLTPGETMHWEASDMHLACGWKHVADQEADQR